METYTYREQPIDADLLSVASILNTSGFFNTEEQDVGVSLVRERLEHGEKCGYFFQFAEHEGSVRGYLLWPIPGTKSSYDLYWMSCRHHLSWAWVGDIALRQTEQEIGKRGGTRIYIETSSSGPLCADPLLLRAKTATSWKQNSSRTMPPTTPSHLCEGW